MLRPVVALGHEVERRRAVALEPIAVAGVPREIIPVVERLNDLFARVRRSFEQERRFTSNAAHELRTPLAALRVQAEVAKAAGNAASTQAALDQVIIACDRLTRLVSQLLMLARIDEQAVSRSPCRLDAIARDVIAELAPQGLASVQEITFESAEAIGIDGNAPLLAAMLRNLLENAMRHGGTPLHIVVSLVKSDTAVVLGVKDDGKGIPRDAMTTLGTRFYRPEGTIAEGSGLGLALVQRIAQWHGGELVLTPGDASRGLNATVTLPPSRL